MKNKTKLSSFNRVISYSLVIATLFILTFQLSAQDKGTQSYFQLTSQDIVMRPYLQAVTHNSITVMVESKNETPIFAYYGEDTDFGKSSVTKFTKPTGADPQTYVHRIVLDSLEPNKNYNYKVIEKGKEYRGSFKTAVLPGTPFKFAAMGDTRTYVNKHGAVAKGIESHSPHFSLYSGDLCAHPTYESWKSEFFIREELSLITNVPFLNAVGNHEDWSTATEAFTEAPPSNSGEQFYYSFDYGDVHFLVISTEHGLSSNAAQVKFAKKDLKNSKAKWKIAMFHIPAYCGGGHGENKVMKNFTTEVLEPNNVDVVLTGHSHFYQSNYVNGIYHIVSAGGGAPLYTPKKMSYTQTQAKVHHYMIWEASADKLAFKVYDIKGNLIDKMELKK